MTGDPADEVVRETAPNALADGLVTHNAADFAAAAAKFPLRLWTPAQFLRRLKAGAVIMANYALRLPDSLIESVRKVAEEEHVSMDPFFVTAMAEKVSALKTEAYFRQRRGRADLVHFDVWLDASPDEPPGEGDEMLPGEDE